MRRDNFQVGRTESRTFLLRRPGSSDAAIEELDHLNRREQIEHLPQDHSSPARAYFASSVVSDRDSPHRRPQSRRVQAFQESLDVLRTDKRVAEQQLLSHWEPGYVDEARYEEKVGDGAPAETDVLREFGKAVAAAPSTS